MYKIFLLMLGSVTALIAQNSLEIKEPICFQNPFMALIKHDTIIQEVKRIKFYLPPKSINNAPLEIYYTLANDKTYQIKNLLCSFDEEKETYTCGIECDDGSLTFDAKNRIMRMKSLQLSSCSDSISIPYFLADTVNTKALQKTIKSIKNPERIGTISTVGFFNENDKDLFQNDWVHESKCEKRERPKVSKVFYTIAEYIKAFPSEENRDFYFQYFSDPLKVNDEHEEIVESMKIKKSYKTIQEFMKEEGFKSKLFKNKNLLLFIHNNKRALSFVSSYVEDESGGTCSFSGHYLMELNNKVLTYKYFTGGHGDISPVLIFEIEN